MNARPRFLGPSIEGKIRPTDGIRKGEHNGSVSFISWTKGADLNGPIGRTGYSCRAFVMPFACSTSGRRMLRT